MTLIDPKIAEIEDTPSRFFAYARERHKVALLKMAECPRPWTLDPILAQYRFTNVYRELDKTTMWFKKHVRDPLRNQPEVLLATVVFRMLNRIETGEALFCQTVMGDREAGGSTAWEYYMAGEGTKVNLLKQAIRAYVGPRGPYVTGAYIISTPPGHAKLDGVMRIIDQFATRLCDKPSCGHADWMCCARRLLESRGELRMQGVFDWLRQFPYLGTFHSYEIVTDLRHTALLDRAPDILTWANMGPGARRGLNRIAGRQRVGRGLRDGWGTPIPAQQALDEMQWLLKLSRDARHWPQENKRMKGGIMSELWPRWEMREVEHTLCEFDKYERVRTGEGKPRGVYR
jgi:hypothetical protein